MLFLTSEIFIIITIISNLIILINGKTYYFNRLKDNNEYRIYNNKDNFDNSPAAALTDDNKNNKNISEMRMYTKNITVQPLQSNLYKEWDYTPPIVNKSDLPIFIYKYYDSLKNSNERFESVRVLFNKMPRNSSVIKFHMDSLKENVSEAHLYFYFIVPDTKLLKQPLILRLYQIENQYFHPDTNKLLNVIYVLQAENSWQIFKITSTIHKWMERQIDFSLMITISKPNDNHNLIYNDTNIGDLRTFLVTKTNTEETIIYGNYDKNKTIPFTMEYCQRRELFVDFTGTHLSKIIIKPEGFQAYNCLGRCFLNDENLTNHAKFTNKRHICCVPTNFASLPIMFYDKNGNIALKFYKDMVVTQCGCR